MNKRQETSSLEKSQVRPFFLHPLGAEAERAVTAPYYSNKLDIDQTSEDKVYESKKTRVCGERKVVELIVDLRWWVIIR